jgi:hypothetical protein
LLLERESFPYLDVMMENSDVWEMLLLLKMLSMMETLLLDLKNSSSGSY